MSKAIEKLLRRMISPNADLRCTASDAMKDSYWRQLKESDNLHSKHALRSRKRDWANRRYRTILQLHVVSRLREGPIQARELCIPVVGQRQREPFSPWP